MSSTWLTTAALFAIAPAAPSGKVGELWETLADPDPMVAYPALYELVDRPDEAVPFIREQLPPAKGPDRKRVDELIGKLDSGAFRSREQATGDLIALGPDVEPLLKTALEDKEISAEARRRLELVMQRLPESPARLRQRRAIQVMEYAGTPETLELLKEWAGGLEGAWLTDQAASAVTRLEHRLRVDQ